MDNLSRDAIKMALDSMLKALTETYFMEFTRIVHPEVYKFIEAGCGLEDALCKFYLGVEPNEESELEPSDTYVEEPGEAGE